MDIWGVSSSLMNKVAEHSWTNLSVDIFFTSLVYEHGSGIADHMLDECVNLLEAAKPFFQVILQLYTLTNNIREF